MTFGQRMRDLRDRRTLKEAAEGCGLSLSYLADLEHDRTEPSIRTLVKLANYYTMPVVCLIEGVEWAGETYERVLMGWTVL